MVGDYVRLTKEIKPFPSNTLMRIIGITKKDRFKLINQNKRHLANINQNSFKEDPEEQ
jgi:hypothetical protein